MPSEPLKYDPPHCLECRFRVRTVFYGLDQAGRRSVDENKVKGEVDRDRSHNIKSEAHYHDLEEACNERCIH